MRYIGIDVGKHGALSILYEDGSTQSIPFDKDDYINAFTRLSEVDCFCVVERVGAMPGQGVVSMFSFGENYGWIQGCLDVLGIPYELVTPQRWKKAFGITRDKNTSIQVAKRLFPDALLLRTQRSRKDDDNVAESILMAEYARRTREV